MKIFLLLVSLCSSLQCADNTVDENDLPSYLQGIGWRNVEDKLRRDLRLSPFVRPTFYDIYLNVTVSGYGNAKRSSFEGTVSITLNISAPVKEFELHSLGLSIQNATLVLPNNEYLNVGEFSINEQRETIVIPSRRAILPGENILILIVYNGTARMDGEGLYESWNRRESSSEGHYISLLTHCEPAAARRWFPCFDEPDKKAIFQISLYHPAETEAYSNTRIESNFTENGVRLTNFKPTVPLPTYLVALAITEQPVVELSVVDGHEFRAIGHRRKLAVEAASKALERLQNHSIFDGVPFIPEKTDILVVEDYNVGAMENPGLITFHVVEADNVDTHIHELAHMYFGNLVTLSTWGDIWVNEGFASFYDSNLKPRSNFGVRSSGLVSLHDLPMHFENNFTSSIHLVNSFGSNSHIHYTRGSQVLRMIRNFVGGEVFEMAIKKYLLDNAYGNGDATKVIKHLVDEYEGDRHQLNTMLYEWIYQAGTALIFVERDENGVNLRQTRYHSTYFDEKLRDVTTRFTIPLFCTIDGESRTIVFDSREASLFIPLQSNSTFTIENNYGDLFGMWSEPSGSPDENWMLLTKDLVKSGIVSVDRFYDLVHPYRDDPSVQNVLPQIIFPKKNPAFKKKEPENCLPEFLNAPFTKVFEYYLREGYNVDVLFCNKHFKTRKQVKWLLKQKILNDKLKIKSSQLSNLIQNIERRHPGATMEFVMKELRKNPTSLYLRLKLNTILEAVEESGTLHQTTIHDFIRAHPSIVAESVDSIMQLLEARYILEVNEKNQEMAKKFRPLRNMTSQQPKNENNISSHKLSKKLPIMEQIARHRLI